MELFVSFLYSVLGICALLCVVVCGLLCLIFALRCMRRAAKICGIIAGVCLFPLLLFAVILL